MTLSPLCGPNATPSRRGRARALALPLNAVVRRAPERAPRRGRAEDHPHTGAAGGAPCGDLVRIAVRIEGDRVAEAGFDADGCGALTAAASAIVESIEGEAVPRCLPFERGRAGEAGWAWARPSAMPRSSPPMRSTARSGPPRRMGAEPDGAERAQDPRRHERRRRLRRGRPARPRRRRRGRGRHARAVVGPRHRRREELLLAAGRARRPGPRPPHGHPAHHARPARAVPRRGRGHVPRRLRRRPHTQPVRPLQRRGALRRHAGARRRARRRAGSPPATTPASPATSTARSSALPPTRARTRATCSPSSTRRCSTG